MKFQLSMPMPCEQHIEEHLSVLQGPEAENIAVQERDERTDYMPFKLEAEGDTLVVTINIQRVRYDSWLHPIGMDDIRCYIQSFLKIPTMVAEQITVNNMTLHYNIFTSRRPARYLALLGPWQLQNGLVRMNIGSSEELAMADFGDYLTDEDNRLFQHIDRTKLLRLQYNITNPAEKFGHPITAVHLLDIEFMRQVIDESVKAFLRMPYFGGYNLYERDDAMHEACFDNLYTENQKLMNEVVEKLLAKAYGKRLTLRYHDLFNI